MQLVYCQYLLVKNKYYVFAIFLSSSEQYLAKIFHQGSLLHEWTSKIDKEVAEQAKNFRPVNLFNELISLAKEFIEENYQ